LGALVYLLLAGFHHTWRMESPKKDKILKGEEKVTLSSSSSLVEKNEVGDNIPRQHWIGSPPHHITPTLVFLGLCN
jgi:hypothetical protein